ncbi:uncharacterized protein LOC110852187 isoform X2 [Folsomia candida]|nr:uncharacterized protein LOC110852187 isoform X2 [Folsomia candida]
MERKRLEKAVDEEIAAEIKTPLETIREESIDGGSYRVKTPEVHVLGNTTPNVDPVQMSDEPLYEISEQPEKINLQEIHENLSEEFGNDVSLDDVKTESLEMEEVEQDDAVNLTTREGEESDTADREMMEQHVNQVLNAQQELGEDDQTSLGTTDVKGASLEIHESEVETMILEEDSVAPGGEGDNDEGMDIGENEIIDTKVGEDGEEPVEEKALFGMETEEATNISESSEKLEKTELEQDEDKIDVVVDKDVPDFETNITQVSPEPEVAVDANTSSQEVDNKEIDNSDELQLPEPEALNENETRSENDESPSKPQIDEQVNDEDDSTEEETLGVKHEKTLSDETIEVRDEAEVDQENVENVNPTVTTSHIQNSRNSVDVELPSLSSLPERPQFTSSDSASTFENTVLPHELLEKHEDSSQDASSLSETQATVVAPQPKPRKPIASISTEDNKSSFETETDVEKNLLKESNDDQTPPPVLRRNKSSPKTRGRAVSSKYRSGIVMDEEVSMEEMEAQIENDMLSQAATKIQAGFRGYITRKTMGVSGRKLDGGGKKKAKLMSDQEEIIIAAAASAPISSAAASASADNLEYIADQGKKPSLSFLRSRSYPGSHDQEEEESGETNNGGGAASSTEVIDSSVELEYDPAYVNNAAIKIQASVRGYLVRKQNKNSKRRGSRKVQEPKQKEVPRVQFDVGNEPENVFVEVGVSQDLPNYGDLIINPDDRDILRDSVSPISDVGSDVAATKIQAAFRGYKERQKVRQTKKAVVTIQATVRGFLTRRRLLKMRRRSLQRRRSSAKSMMTPEVQKIKKANDAATKIQAVYRGYQVRSKIRKGGIEDDD